MKNSLGKLSSIIIIYLLTITTVYAEDFTYNFQVDNQTPYVKEGLLLTLELNQTNEEIVLLFNFDLKKSNNYSFIRVDTIETDTHHNARVKYVYLVYPLKEGEVNIEFTLLKKVTTDESVAYSFSGDRDNVKGLITTDTPITLAPLQLTVKALPKNTLLVGDFTLNYHLTKHKAKAYEPIPFQVTIEGRGYPPKLDSILANENNFTLFSEQPLINSKATVVGTQNRMLYPMALSHSKDFKHSPIVIKAFNPKTEKSYELNIPEQIFEIEEVAVENLIDKHDSPATLEQNWSWLSNLLSYLIVFIAGYLTALSWKWKSKVTVKKSNPLVLKIENCNNKKELLQLLMATDSRHFTSTIEHLEGALYFYRTI